jgi:hypothetical protein
MHRLIAKAKRIAYTSEPCYHYIQRTNSISRNKKINFEQMEASLSQLQFFQDHFPELIYIAETACAFSHMGIITSHLGNQVQYSPDLFRKIRRVCKKHLKSVLRNAHIPKSKKLQALSFCYAFPIYKAVIERTKHR